MGKKYIIEIIGGEEGDMDFSTIEPYTEPDMEQVRKEAYYKGYETAKHECEDCNANAVKIADDNAHEAYQKGLEDAWDAARKIIHMPEGDILNTFTDVYAAVCTAVQVILKYDVKEAIDCIRRQEEENGLRQNIQTIVDECGYSLDEIAEVLQKMRETE